jgi:hypothetical protein
MINIFRPATVVVAAAAVVLAATGCGNPDPPSPPPAAPAGNGGNGGNAGNAGTGGGARTQTTAARRPATTPPTTANRNAGVGDNTVSGTTSDRRGRPLAGVHISILVVPRSFGALYQTYSDRNGRYSYRVPGGVYNVIATYDDPNDDDPIGVDLELQGGGDSGISVPPSQVLHFRLP